MLGALFQRVRALRARPGGWSFLGGCFADGHGFAHAGQLDRLFGSFFRERHDGFVNLIDHGGRFGCGWLACFRNRANREAKMPLLTGAGSAAWLSRGAERAGASGFAGSGSSGRLGISGETRGEPLAEGACGLGAVFWGCAVRILEAARNRREAQGQGRADPCA